jgi:hypothetical protein
MRVTAARAVAAVAIPCLVLAGCAPSTNRDRSGGSSAASAPPPAHFAGPRDGVVALFEGYKTLDAEAITGAVCPRLAPLALARGSGAHIVSFSVLRVVRHSPITASVTYRAVASDSPQRYTATITTVKGSDGWKVCQLTGAQESQATDLPSPGRFSTSPAEPTSSSTR